MGSLCLYMKKKEVVASLSRGARSVRSLVVWDWEGGEEGDSGGEGEGEVTSYGLTFSPFFSEYLWSM